MQARRTALLTIVTLVAWFTQGAHTRSIKQPDFNWEAFGDVMPLLSEPEEPDNVQLAEQKVHYSAQFSKTVSSRYFNEHSEKAEIDPTKSLKIEKIIEKHYCIAPSQDPRGWVKVGNFNMTQPGSICPDEFKETTIQVPGKPDKRVCSRSRDGISCYSFPIPVIGREYSRVSGRVRAYQRGVPNAFGPTVFVPEVTTDGINAQYVDGVSITTISDTQPPKRSHVWTFAASGGRKGDQNGYDLCPCEGGTVEILDVIGSDYFCDAASNNIEPSNDGKWYPEYPLWDGEYGEGACDENKCCKDFKAKSGPEFCKILSNKTAEDLELRLCVNGDSAVEDIGIESFEIYVR